MPLVTTAKMFKAAYDGGFAIGAFNVNNMELLQAIVEAAQRGKRKLMVNFSNRWMPYMAHTRRAIEDGELGYPIYAYARLSNTIYVPTKMLESWSSKTSLPFWLMSHTIDRIRWLFQSEITRVYAVSHASVLTRMGIDSPDLFAALVDFLDLDQRQIWSEAFGYIDDIGFPADQHAHLVFYDGLDDIPGHTFGCDW